MLDVTGLYYIILKILQMNDLISSGVSMVEIML